MDNKFVELKRYIESNIAKIEQRIVQRNEMIEQKSNIESLIATLRQNLAEINSDQFGLLKRILNDEEYLTHTFSVIIGCAPYFNDEDLCNESQVVQAKVELSKLIEKIVKISENLDLKIHKFGHKDRDLLQITNYEKYLSIFDENGMVKYLEPNELDSFLKFIRTAPLELSKEEVLDLITEISKSSINYIIRRKEAIVSQQLVTISRNSREILDEINNNVTLESTVEQQQEVVEELVIENRSLTEEEEKKLHYIEGIITWMIENYGIGNITVDFDGFIDDNDFNLEDRIAFYELATAKKEMWISIYADLKKYLIQSFYKKQENVDDIMKIFDYIISLYNKENIIVEVKLYEFTKAELDIRKKAALIIQKYNTKLMEYQNLDNADRNYIDSMYDVIIQNDYDNIAVNSRFSLLDIKLYKRLDKLNADLKDLEDTLLNEEELRKLSTNEEDIDELIKMFLEGISDTVAEIETLEKHIEEENKSQLIIEESSSLEYTTGSNTMNLLVFLENSNIHRQSFYEEDKESLSKIDKGKYKSIKNAFQVVSTTAFTDQSKNSGFVQLSP